MSRYQPRPAPPQPVRPTQLLPTPWGPCAGCGVTCRRYGVGGNPLCEQCNPKTGTEERVT